MESLEYILFTFLNESFGSITRVKYWISGEKGWNHPKYLQPPQNKNKYLYSHSILTFLFECFNGLGLGNFSFISGRRGRREGCIWFDDIIPLVYTKIEPFFASCLNLFYGLLGQFKLNNLLKSQKSFSPS